MVHRMLVVVGRLLFWSMGSHVLKYLATRTKAGERDKETKKVPSLLAYLSRAWRLSCPSTKGWRVCGTWAGLNHLPTPYVIPIH